MKYRDFTSDPRYSNAENKYYGSINEIPEAQTLEASTLEEFEHAFHDAVDEYITAQNRITASNKRWRKFIAPLILLGLIIVMIISCPKKEKHLESLTDTISSVLLDGEDSDIVSLGRMLGNPVSRLIVNTYVTVNDYVLCSIGRFDYEGEKHIVSVGILGHVFTIPKNTLKRLMEQDQRMQDLTGD